MRSFLAIALAASLVSASRAEITLVQEGASEYVIVRPARSTPSQVYAAGELQAITRRMTGVTLPVITDEAALPDRAILLGETRHTAAILGESAAIAALGNDGFRLCVRSPHLLVIGSGVRGTLYGVYELLERFGGCRWYASFFSRIPKRKSWTVPAVDRTEIPAFVMREPYWFDMFDGDFAARSRSNGNRPNLREKHGGKIRFGGGMFVHTFYRLMPPAEFFAAHPEYYSEIDGKRRSDGGQLCLTNPDVLRILTGRVLERIRKDPAAKLFSVSQNDWRGYCTCADCRAVDEREGSPSGTMIAFVNRVAEAVEKEFPDAWIETLAYQYTRHPPRTVRPRHNVVPRLCSIECDFSVPLDKSTYEQNVSFVQDMKGWAAISDKLYVWDYTTNFRHYIGPHPNFNALQGNAKFFRDNRVVGLFEQGAYQSRHAEFAELRAWLLAKLLWNPDQDVEALYKDFFDGYYGPAAGTVRTYFGELQALVAPPEHVLRIFLGMKEKWYTDAFLERAEDLWHEAERLAQGTEYAAHVRMGAIPVWYAQFQRLPPPSGRWAWSGGTVKQQVQDATYVSLAREILTRMREGGITHAAENTSVNAAFLNTLRGCTEGFPPAEVKGAGLTAGVVAELGARVVTLRRGAGANVLHPGLGGVGFSLAPGDLLGRDKSAFTLARNAGGRAELDWYRYWRPYKLQRIVQLGQNGLSVGTKITSTRTQPQRIKPVLGVALDLGDVRRVAMRAGDGEWTSLSPAAGQVVGTRTLPGSALTGKDLLVASGATKRGVRLKVADMRLERVFCLQDARSGAVQLAFVGERRDLGSHATLCFGVEVEPVESTVTPPPPPGATAPTGVLVAEDCLFSIGKLGTWGDFVRDEGAADGFAARLTNSHYEWCLQWKFDPGWFEEGATYRLEMRARIDHTGKEGEAFWAGVYDAGRSKGCCSTRRVTSQMEPGYAWYELGDWIPQPNQYVWVGPGRFDKKAGASSAIGALYVDSFRLTRVSSE